MRVSEVAAWLDCSWEGVDIEIGGVGALESAGCRDLAFVQSAKTAELATSSAAGCLLVTPDFPSGRTLIRVNEPRAAFAKVVRRLYPPEPVSSGIHASAVVAASARVDATASIGPHVTVGEMTRVGARTIVGAGSSIGARVSIGADCVIHSNVTLYSDVSIGDRVVLHSGCVLGADGFGFVLVSDRSGDDIAAHYEKFPQIGRVLIGDDVEIGANSCIDRAALGTTEIGSGTKLDNMVHVAHNCRIGKHVVVAAQTGFSGSVVVEDYAVIGGQVGVGDKARIETKVVVGSGSGILTSKVVRKGQLVWGTPARPLKEYLDQLASLARLPELRREVKELKRQLAELKNHFER